MFVFDFFIRIKFINIVKLKRKLLAEFIGTAFLLAVVVGSGIMGENLAGGNVAVALLANTLATGAGLAFLILCFEAISGAHFNPAVTLTEGLRGNLNGRQSFLYLSAQISGAFIGVGLANLMFEKPIYFLSHKIREGSSQFLSELIATFGLIMVIRAGVRFRPKQVYLMVAAYITAAYWFTASTSFANPAVTLARSVSDTFAGIKPVNAPMFIVAQLLGALTATFVFNWLFDEKMAKSLREKSDA
ncbi:MAG: MIP/aquaporin family protein [Pyrinomonadaceae bacterium]